MPSSCSCRTTPLALTTLVASLLAGCEGSPGASELRVLSPEDASERWRERIATEWFTAEQEAPDGVLRVRANDDCWEANTIIDFDRESGVRLSETPLLSSAQSSGEDGPFDPPSACESGFYPERVALPSGEQLDLCGRAASDAPLVVMNVAARTERFRVPASGMVDPWVFADRLLLTPVAAEGRIQVFSLDTGAPLWAWTSPEEYTYVRGVDSERVYAWAEGSHETYALALADGSSVWQKNLGCEWLSLLSERLVCGRSLSESSCEASD